MDDVLIDRMIDAVVTTCTSWVDVDRGGNPVVVDPLEHRAIGSHYATSHLAAALLLGFEDEHRSFTLGVDLVRGVLARWSEDSAAYDFHADFNNFALCLAIEKLESHDEYKALAEEAKATVLATPDSNHSTINWLPLRVFVNLCRYAWCGDSRFLARVGRSNRLLAAARRADGLIDDRLPRDRSFNLQYDVYTVAMLELLSRRGVEYAVRSMVPPLIEACDPEGDINYLGRGCNQIFAWGPWLFLLRSTGQEGLLEKSSRYLAQRLPWTLENHNVLLNEFPGVDRDYWWDYHYCSVYTSHLLLWLILTRNAVNDGTGDSIMQPVEPLGEGGLHVSRADNAFVAIFDGRKEYFAERGPSVANVWTAKRGAVMKGALGPWGKPFGERYTSPVVSLNHFGLLELGVGRKCGGGPIFAPVRADLAPDAITLEYATGSHRGAVLNLPLLSSCSINDLSVFAGSNRLSIRPVGRIRNPYGEALLVQSTPARASRWKVMIQL